MLNDLSNVPDAELATNASGSEDKSEILARVATFLDNGDLRGGRDLVRREYPFTPAAKSGRRYTERQSLRIFYRDGFIDRYSGTRLVNPGALRLLSVLLPEEFPAHPNWLMTQSHFAFWELFPSIDHLDPVSRGGVDSESNWVTTSMLRNSAKAHWTIRELGWSLHPVGDHASWDGLSGWFVDFLHKHPEHLTVPYLGRWYRATAEIRSGFV